MTTFVHTMKKMQIKKMVLSLFFGAVMLATSYGYLVNETVMNVVELEKNESTIADMRSSIAELESAALALREKMSVEYAHSLGFVEVATTYAHVGPSGLTFNKAD